MRTQVRHQPIVDTGPSPAPPAAWLLLCALKRGCRQPGAVMSRPMLLSVSLQSSLVVLYDTET